MTDPHNPPDTPALDAWYKAHPWGNDRPTTYLWMPRESPDARLDLIDRGCELPPILGDPAKPTVHVRHGQIDVGGYLSDMEDYYAAALDALKVARWQANEIAQRMAEEDSEATP